MAKKVSQDIRYNIKGTSGDVLGTVSSTEIASMKAYTQQIMGLDKALNSIQTGMRLTVEGSKALAKAQQALANDRSFEEQEESWRGIRASLNDYLSDLRRGRSAAQSLTSVLSKQTQQMETLEHLRESGEPLLKREAETLRRTLNINKQRLDLAAKELSINMQIDPEKKLSVEDQILESVQNRGRALEAELRNRILLQNISDAEIKQHEKQIEQVYSLAQGYQDQLEIAKQLSKEQQDTSRATQITRQAAGPFYTPIQKLIGRLGGTEASGRMAEARERAFRASKTTYGTAYELEKAAGKADSEANKSAKAAALEAARRELRGGAKEAALLTAKVAGIAAAGWLVVLPFRAIGGILKGLGTAAKKFFDGFVGLARNAAGRIQGFFRSVWSRMMEISGPSADLIRTIGESSTRAIGSIRAAGQDSIEKMNNLREIAESIEVDPVTFFNTEDISTAVSLKKQLGLSAEQAGNLAIRAKMAGVSAQGYEDYVDQAYKTSQKQSNLEGSRYRITTNLNQINKKLLGTSNEMAVAFGLSNTRLTDAVMQATKLGLELDDIKSVANNLLDFESSIGAEMEAQLLTGQQMNLNQARLAALQGDYVALGQELEKQNITAERYGEMNLIQRNAVAKALGMSNEQLAKMLIQQSKSADLSDEARAHLMGMTLEQYKAVSLQDSWNNQINAMREQFIPIIAQILPTIFKVMSKILDVARQIAPRITAFVGRLMPFVRQLWDIVSRMIDRLMSLDLSPILRVVQAVVGVAGTAFQSLIGGATGRTSAEESSRSPVSTLGEGLGTALRDVIGTVASIGSELVDGFVGILPTLVDVLGVIVTNLGPVAVQLIRVVVNVLGNLLKGIVPLLKPIVEFLTTAVKQLMPLVDALVSAIIPSLSSILGYLVPVATSLVSTLLPPLIDVIRVIGNVLNGVVVPVLNFLMPVVTSLVEIFNSLVGVIISLPNKFWSWATSWLPKLADKISQWRPIRVAGAFIKWLGAIISNIAKTILELPTMWFGSRKEKEEVRKARELREKELEGLKSVWQSRESTEAYASGGIVGGSSFTGDRVPIRTNSGEMVLTRNQQGHLFDFLQGKETSLESTYTASQAGQNTGDITELKAELTNLISEVRRGFTDQIQATRDNRTTINCDWDWVKFDAAYGRNVSLI